MFKRDKLYAKGRRATLIYGDELNYFKKRRSQLKGEYNSIKKTEILIKILLWLKVRGLYFSDYPLIDIIVPYYLH